MPHWIGYPQVDIQVRFDSERKSSLANTVSTFHGNDQICGKVVFTLKKINDALRYRVVVKGNVQTKITNSQHGSLSNTSDVDTHTFMSAIIFDGPQSAVPIAGSKHQAEVPFQFSLQDGQLSQNSPDSQSDLLPSLDSRSASRHWSDAFKTENVIVEYQTTYTVIASAILNKKVVASVPRRFQFLPESPSSDPVDIEDYPGEYSLRTSTMQQKGTTSTRIGIISQEPASVSFRRGESSSGTQLNLLFMLVRSFQGGYRPEPAPKRFSVKAQLKTTTFVMPTKQPRPELHTLQAAPYSKAIIKQAKSHTQNQTVEFSQWESHDSESEDDRHSNGEEVLTNATTIPFTIDQALTPTFWSPLLSRRYTIELSVTLDDDPSTTTKLRLPVQVHYE